MMMKSHKGGNVLQMNMMAHKGGDQWQQNSWTQHDTTCGNYYDVGSTGE